IDNGAPCIPLLASGTVFADLIDGFVFGNINNTGSGGTENPPYTDYRNSGPDFITSVAPGGTYTATITSGSDGADDSYAIWVDLDHDLTFEPNELLGQGATTSLGVQTTLVDVPIPADAPRGYTTLRVMCSNGGIPTDVCGLHAFGEVEDYTVVIDDGAPCIPLYGAQASQGHYVSSVQVEGLSWTAPGGPIEAYTDATNNGAHLQAGATSTLTVFGGSASSGYLSAWVDWSGGFQLIGSLPVGTGFAQVGFDITPAPNYVGYARLRVAHTDAIVGACDPSDFGSAVDFTLSVAHAGWPCLPLLGYGTQFGDGVTDVTVEVSAQATQPAFPYYTISNCPAYHYNAGGEFTVSFTAGQYAPETYRLCMDMNDDGDFSDANEALLTISSTYAGEQFGILLNIPASCPPGQHFMRLRANDDANFPLVDLCQDQLYGQILDWVVAVEDPAGPCIPFIFLWTTSGDFIDGVQLGTIQNTGNGSAFGAAYQDYTAQSSILTVGQAATLTITGGAYGGDTYSAWIDYNADNDFDDAGESLGWIGIPDDFGTNDLPFTVPPGTTLGSKRMRVRCAGIGTNDACLDDFFGETEDYTVFIETSTGLAAPALADVRVQPTEAGALLVSPAAYIGYTCTLHDATGRVLWTDRITSDRTELPMATFARGAYTVQLSSGAERVVKRFVW
ncbi:MAG TPA: GEVED domain-containing protein, partial [Flavobacteriales bacterium]|nr:GEVED domain-containing protein [Flavobacteriales bacterium]